MLHAHGGYTLTEGAQLAQPVADAYYGEYVSAQRLLLQHLTLVRVGWQQGWCWMGQE